MTADNWDKYRAPVTQDRINKVATPEEIFFTQGGNNTAFTPKNTDEWHTPVALLIGDPEYTLDRIKEERKELGFIGMGVGTDIILGYPDQKIVSKLSEIDPETGRTIKDPEISGILDQETGEIVPVTDRDLTQELRDKFKEWNMELHPREEKQLQPAEMKG